MNNLGAGLKSQDWGKLIQPQTKRFCMVQTILTLVSPRYQHHAQVREVVLQGAP